MSVFVLNKNYELQLPGSYTDVDAEEIEYIDGGFYISNSNLSAGLFAFIGAYRANALIVTRVVGTIANGIKYVAAQILKWVGRVFGGVVGGIVGWAIGNFSGYAIGIYVGRALISGKGINVSWDGLSIQ